MVFSEGLTRNWKKPESIFSAIFIFSLFLPWAGSFSGFRVVWESFKFHSVFEILIPLTVIGSIVLILTPPKTFITKILAIATGVFLLAYYLIGLIRGVKIFEVMTIGSYIALIISVGFILSGFGIVERWWIKYKLNMYRKTRTRILVKLGQKVWQEKVDLTGIDKLKQELEKNEKYNINYRKEIEKLDLEIKQIKDTFEKFRQEKESVIGLEEKNKKPLLENLNKAKALLNDADRDINQLDLIEKDLQKFEMEIEKLTLNQKLTENERELRRKAARENIDNLQKRQTDLKEKLPILTQTKSEQEEKVNTLKKDVAVYNEKIKSLREDINTQNRQLDEQIGDLERQKRDFNLKLNEIKRLNMIVFENIGNIANQNRLDNTKLKGLYDQIDDVDKKTKELETR